MEQLEWTSVRTARPEGMRGPVYEIYSDNAAGPFDGDILYLRSKADLAIRAKMYWSGLLTNTPMIEWLLPFPLTIGRQVGTI
jgi:hypothetical protein